MVSLPALCLRGKFCDLLLVNTADLPRPLVALDVVTILRSHPPTSVRHSATSSLEKKIFLESFISVNLVVALGI